MLNEKLSQCDLISKYLGNIQHYEYYVMDSNYYGITVEGNFSSFSGNYNFAVRNDSLCQFYFMAALPKKSNSLKELSITLDSLILAWTGKFGPPDLFIDGRVNSTNTEVENSTILSASWKIKQDILKLRFSYGESLRDARGNFNIIIHRYRECYFDKKFFPQWRTL